MTRTVLCQCNCGKTVFEIDGPPIFGVECCCTSCRIAGEKMQKLDGAPQILTPNGTTPVVMYRKDRVRFVSNVEGLVSFSLTPKSGTRRVLASCCNTPMFVEFKAGHWLSLFADIWPEAERPIMQMRTMASDMPDGIDLPLDIPNVKTHNFTFFAKLLGAWAAMGFRSPKIKIDKQLEII